MKRMTLSSTESRSFRKRCGQKWIKPSKSKGYNRRKLLFSQNSKFNPVENKNSTLGFPSKIASFRYRRNKRLVNDHLSLRGIESLVLEVMK